MQRTAKDEEALGVFRTLADEERTHLDRLTALFEKRLSA
jgi:rubrerythrin